MKREPDSRELQIVLVGGFNPTIFTPMWLALKKIISEEEALAASVEFSHPEFSKFEVSDFCYEIYLDRFIARTRHQHLFENLQDNIIKIFNFLLETPIRQVGINWHNSYTFALSEHEKYINFGHKHLPKSDFWSKHLQNPGLYNLKIQAERSDEYSGNINVYINKSEKTALTVELLINDHYDLTSEETKVIDATKAIGILGKNFGVSRDSSSKLLSEICEYGLQ